MKDPALRNRGARKKLLETGQGLKKKGKARGTTSLQDRFTMPRVPPKSNPVSDWMDDILTHHDTSRTTVVFPVRHGVDTRSADGGIVRTRLATATGVDRATILARDATSGDIIAAVERSTLKLPEY